MNLIRFNRPEFWTVSPFEQFHGLRDELNRLFEAPFGELSRAGECFNVWAPALDLREDNENFVAAIELPGLQKEDIEVSVHDGVLSVSGERRREKKDQESEAYRTERFYGRFHRTLSLPKPVQIEAVKATYKDGILSITLPKTEEAKPKQIEVSVG